MHFGFITRIIAQIRKDQLLSVLLLIVSLSFYTCVNSHKANISESEVSFSVTDFRGKALKFKESPKRIVCLIESALSGFYMLHAEDRIIAVSSSVYDDAVYNAYAKLDDRIENKSLPAPGNWDFVSNEHIVALKPDLVIMWASQTESIDAIESKEIPVYAVMIKSTADIYKEISDFGLLTASEKRADSLIQYTKSELLKMAEAAEKITKEKQKVYFMWAQGPLETSGTNSTVNELIEMAGAQNACTSSDEHLVVNLEKVIEWNPDVIVMWFDANKNPEDIMNLSGWGTIKAVKDKRVFELPSVFMCDLWTLKFQYAAKLLSAWSYPEDLANIDPEMEKAVMLNKLYGRKGEDIE